MKSKTIVRIAATLTAFLALSALAFLVRSASWVITHETNPPESYKLLGALGLLAIVPMMFIWAAIQAWRCRPKGIVSLSSIWILFGLGGSIFHLFWFFTDWRIKDAVVATVWTCIFLFGVLIARQEKKIRDQTFQH